MSADMNKIYELLKEVDAKVSKMDEMHEKINTLCLVLQAMEIKQTEETGGTRNIKMPEEKEKEKEDDEEKEEPKKKTTKKVVPAKKNEDVKSINKLEFFKKMFMENEHYFDELLGMAKSTIDRENADAWVDLDKNKLLKEKLKVYYNYIKNDSKLDGELQNLKHSYISELKKSNIRINKTEEH